MLRRAASVVWEDTEIEFHTRQRERRRTFRCRSVRNQSPTVCRPQTAAVLTLSELGSSAPPSSTCAILPAVRATAGEHPKNTSGWMFGLHLSEDRRGARGATMQCAVSSWRIWPLERNVRVCSSHIRRKSGSEG